MIVHGSVVHSQDLAGRVTTDVTFAEVVVDHARRYPEAPAVRSGGRCLTFGQLVARAAETAAALQNVGIGPGSRVGVLLDRSVDLPAVLLGVWWVGAAYVPLDPRHPRDRLSLVLEDAHPQALVSQSGYATGLVKDGMCLVDMDAPHFRRAGSTADTVPTPTQPDDVAYVIYTSGSTGRPKGVVVQHRGVANLLRFMATEPGLRAGEVMLGVTTPSFDLSVPDLFLPMFTGAELVLATREEATDGRLLARLLEDVNPDVMQATPATWRMLVDAGWTQQHGLRAVCGGEAWPPTLAGQLLDRVDALWNFYGPTETTVWSTCARIPAAEDSPPIGSALPGTTLRVVDASLDPVEDFSAGELLIGGVGVAAGYFDRPDLTEERFTHVGGERVYRTGDLVRKRDDGNLVYVGRLDDQVKVDGFRIELGDVEAALARHPDVAEAAAAVHEDSSGVRLIGYVVLRDSPLSGNAVRRYIADFIPGHMVPSIIVALEQLPRNPHGKIDRSALPAPISGQGETRPVTAPRDVLEAKLVALWEDILGIRPIGVTDDFFDLGVNSLTAARLFTALDAEFPGELRLPPVFQAPTIAHLAELLRSSATSNGPTSLVPLQIGAGGVPLFCVHGGSGTILLFNDLARRLSSTHSVYGLQAVGLYGRDAPQTSVQSMAERYLTEIRDVQPQGPYALAGWCFGGVVAYEMARRLIEMNETVAFVAMMNAATPSYERELIARLWVPPPQLTPAERVRARWSRTTGRVPSRAGQLLAAITHQVIGRTRVRVQDLRLESTIRRGKPLPQGMRDQQFQVLAYRALMSYVPPRSSIPLLVFRAAGEYDRPDLGWSAHTDRPIVTFETAGGFPSQRTSMEEPHVRLFADPLLAHLTAIARK